MSLRLQPMFKGGEEPEIFPSPRAYIEKKSSAFFHISKTTRKIRIFSSLKAYMEETVRIVTPRTSRQAVFEGGGVTGVFLSPRGCIQGVM